MPKTLLVIVWRVESCFCPVQQVSPLFYLILSILTSMKKEERQPTKPRKQRNLPVVRTVKGGRLEYYHRADKTTATKKEFFSQFIDDHDYPFVFENLFTHEKQTLRALQRIKIKGRFIKKEAADKIDYHKKTKGLKLKNNDASVLGKETLSKILSTEQKKWMNSDRVLKKMIDRVKAGKKVSIKYRDKVYNGNDAILIFSKYVEKLKSDAEKKGDDFGFALFKVNQKPT